MAYFSRPTLSAQASNEIAYAIGNKLPITFTRLSLGSGQHTSNLDTVTNTANHIMSIPANQSLEDVGNEIRVMGRLDNRTVTSTLFIREIGVFAKVGNRDEFLYLYTASDDADIVPPGTDASVIRDYTFNTRIDPSGELEITYTIGEDVYGKYTEIVKVANDLQAHIDDLGNPHQTDKTDVGLSNVTNDKQAKEVDFNAHKNAINPHGITKTTIGLSNVDNVQQAPLTDFNTHKDSRANPHSTTKAQVGLGNVDNFSTANEAQALAGTARNLFMTPFLTNMLLTNIIDSGSGSSGKEFWIRLKDGTQIIYGQASGKQYNVNGVDVQWDTPFLKPFVDFPVPISMDLLIDQDYSDSMGWQTMGQITATYNQNRIWRDKFRSLITTYQNPTKVELMYAFIGRWK